MIAFDPMYFVFVGPAILLAIWAQFKVKSAYHEASQIPSMGGMTGAQAAREVLDLNGLQSVGIEQAEGFLSDHYDPSHRVLRLSPDVYHGHNLAALGIAAHEAGHALQHAKGYAPLVIRNGLVPLASVGSWMSGLLIMGGMLIMMVSQSPAMSWLILAGVGLFGVTVVFQLVNLPVEFDASSRAKATLVQYGIVHEQELGPIKRVLGAAAMTYVAATLSAVLTLLYYLWRLGLLGGSNSRE
jgi:Zn-dependent membrane protease YugP